MFSVKSELYANLYGSFDTQETMGGESVNSWPLNEFQVTQSREVET